MESANQRCDQENVIEQLKNGVNAMRIPVNDLLSNWAYMVIAALAWKLKSWFAMMMPDREKGRMMLKMEFRRFSEGPERKNGRGRLTVEHSLVLGLARVDSIEGLELIEVRTENEAHLRIPPRGKN